MAKSDYVPDGDNDFLSWHNRFAAEVEASTAVLGLTAEEIAAVAADNAAWRDALAASLAADAAAQQATGLKKAARRTAEQRARALAQKMKRHPNYTDAIGEGFGIVGPENTVDLAASKPSLKAVALPHGNVEVRFNKSKSHGVNIYCQREGDSGFVFLARDTASPYVDNRPCLVPGKPETRRYKAIYVFNDRETGQFSDELSVTCQP